MLSDLRRKVPQGKVELRHKAVEVLQGKDRAV